MKKMSYPFRVFLEAKSLGYSVVSVRFGFTGNICPYDANRITLKILDQLVISGSVDYHLLDDGSYILVCCGPVVRELNLASCFRSESHDVCFNIPICLDDNNEHDVRVSLVHRFDERHDYFNQQRRVIDLNGSILLDVPEDETKEE